MILSCVCLPDQSASKIIQGIMDEVSNKCGSVNALKFPPHFSIRGDFEVEDSKLPLLFDSVGEVVKKYSRIRLNLNKYGFYPWKIIYLDIDNTEELEKLHSDLMMTIQKFRTDWVPDSLLKSEHFEGKQKEYINNYGYQFAFEYYSPHFTLAGNDMAQEKFETVRKELEGKIENIEVVVEKVVLFDRDHANSILRSFLLGER